MGILVVMILLRKLQFYISDTVCDWSLIYLDWEIISIKLDGHCVHLATMIVIQPSVLTVVSIFFGTPLHIISTGDSPHVTAALSLSKLSYFDSY